MPKKKEPPFTEENRSQLCLCFDPRWMHFRHNPDGEGYLPSQESGCHGFKALPRCDDRRAMALMQVVSVVRGPDLGAYRDADGGVMNLLTKAVDALTVINKEMQARGRELDISTRYGVAQMIEGKKVKLEIQRQSRQLRRKKREKAKKTTYITPKRRKQLR